jgi:hypothetical protein
VPLENNFINHKKRENIDKKTQQLLQNKATSLQKNIAFFYF